MSEESSMVEPANTNGARKKNVIVVKRRKVQTLLRFLSHEQHPTKSVKEPLSDNLIVKAGAAENRESNGETCIRNVPCRQESDQVDEYIRSLNDRDSCFYRIAKDHFVDSFRVSNTVGFKRWQEREQ